jgi:oxygen-independent coproporphyrinogen-3 oxidase
MTTSSNKTEVGSYFISNYPPFSAWSTDQVEEVRAALMSPPADVPLGLYLHIPFCRKRCKFCYFKVFTEKNSTEVERYLAALSREIELVSKLPVMGSRPFRFVYFGGGTPSFLSSRQLERSTGCGPMSPGMRRRKSRSSVSPERCPKPK